MDDQAKLQRVARVFRARLLIGYGTDAPEQPRPVAEKPEGPARDELGAEPSPEEY